MTQNEHTWLAMFITLIIYQTIWHLFLKHHPATQKNIKEMSDMFIKWF
jgi:hypothetical protein